MHLASGRHEGDFAIAAARERFAAGENVEHVVRPEILLSWYRCRDEYRIDPGQRHAPPADDYYTHSLKNDWVVAELGSVGKSLLPEVDALGGLLAITDGAGRILTVLGTRGALSQGEQSSLASWFAWSERTAGTNGMGTALHDGEGALVRRSEHWCEAFHNWSCAGIPITDPITGQALAALDISSWRKPFPDDVLPWLRRSVQGIGAELRKQAAREASSLKTALERADLRTSRPLVALDGGGALVAATEKAESLIGEPAARLSTDCPELARFVSQGMARAAADHAWTGTAAFFLPHIDDLVPITIRPVVANGRVLGFLGVLGESEGEPLNRGPPPAPSPSQRRVAAVAATGHRLVLLRPNQITFAEADRNTVWLATDQGRFRAQQRGLGRLESQLHAEGFLRTHRHFLVNLKRVQEVSYGVRGQLSLRLDSASALIPVSKRRAPSIRRALKLLSPTACSASAARHGHRAGAAAGTIGPVG